MLIGHRNLIVELVLETMLDLGMIKGLLMDIMEVLV
jgi:hypothetical protein